MLRFSTILIAGIGFASSVPALAENLVDVFKLAEEKDPQYRSVQAAYRAVQEGKPQARALAFLPSIDVTASVGFNEQTITQAAGSQFGGTGTFRFQSHDYSLNLTQPIFHYDRYAALEQADQRIKQAEIDLSAELQDLSVRVAERYFDVLAAIDELEFALAEKKALERQLEQAKQRFEVGLIAVTDVQEAQAGYDRALADEIQASNQLDISREALREITGQYHQQVAALAQDVPLIKPEPVDVEKWTQKALEGNLRLASANTAAGIAQEEIKRQAAGHAPTLDLVGSHGMSSTGGRFGDVEIEQNQVALQLNVPIYQGGLVNSRTREAEHRHTEALEKLEQQRRAAHRDTRDSFLNVISGISRVTALKQAVVSNETAVQATTAGFEVGTRTAVDVVTSERNLFAARRDLARARYDYVLHTLRLKRAVGSLSVQDLVKVNEWLMQQAAAKPDEEAQTAN